VTHYKAFGRLFSGRRNAAWACEGSAELTGGGLVQAEDEKAAESAVVSIWLEVGQRGLPLLTNRTYWLADREHQGEPGGENWKIRSHLGNREGWRLQEKLSTK